MPVDAPKSVSGRTIGYLPPSFTDMRERDTRDRSRSMGPLRPAADAIIINTSNMDADDVFVLALSHITV